MWRSEQRAGRVGMFLTMGQAGMISAQGPVIPEIFIWTYLREKITVVLQWNDPGTAPKTTMTSICVTAGGRTDASEKVQGGTENLSNTFSTQYGRHQKSEHFS